MTTEVLAMPAVDLKRKLSAGGWVTYAGELALMSHDQFIEVVESHGSRFSRHIYRGTRLIVVGGHALPLTNNGALADPIRRAQLMYRRGDSKPLIVSEEQFVSALQLSQFQHRETPLYTLATLTEILGVTRNRIRAWTAAGLIKPQSREHGVWQFDFAQVAAAKTLCDLTRTGVTTRRLRRSLEQLQHWLPVAEKPLQQLSVMEQTGELLVRLEEGGLAELDGQLQLDFSAEKPAESLRLYDGPTSARQWFGQGIEQEQSGYLAEATDSYREALKAGGPNAEICCNLANVLAAQGQRVQAMERYLQSVETDPTYAQAWNNLGTLLCAMEKREEACQAFRQAVQHDPDLASAHYNLADTLEEMGRHTEATKHWKIYLRFDSQSDWGRYAKRQLG